MTKIMIPPTIDGYGYGFLRILSRSLLAEMRGRGGRDPSGLGSTAIERILEGLCSKTWRRNGGISIAAGKNGPEESKSDQDDDHRQKNAQFLTVVAVRTLVMKGTTCRIGVPSRSEEFTAKC